MSKRLYIGNVPYSMTSEKLKEVFAPYGDIEEATIVTFKDSGRSKGFGFVTFVQDESAVKAMAELNGKEVEGRKMFVNEAQPFDPSKPRERRPFRSGGGGGRFGGGGGRFGGGRRFGDRDGGNGGFGGHSHDHGGHEGHSHNHEGQ
jgi:RNA recognition motif-containing protein